ncbi:hypothetical protein Pelo_9903 [Pelomyxa schiedti]|nr:hypothetical protein Pelo_9903 [Pelomyxa schiedti]
MLLVDVVGVDSPPPAPPTSHNCVVVVPRATSSASEATTHTKRATTATTTASTTTTTATTAPSNSAEEYYREDWPCAQLQGARHGHCGRAGGGARDRRTHSRSPGGGAASGLAFCGGVSAVSSADYGSDEEAGLGSGDGGFCCYDDDDEGGVVAQAAQATQAQEGLCSKCAGFVDVVDERESYHLPPRTPSKWKKSKIDNIICKKVNANGRMRYLIVMENDTSPVWRDASEVGWSSLLHQFDQEHEDSIRGKQSTQNPTWGRTCHQCHQKHAMYMCCTKCLGALCVNCLWNHYPILNRDACMHTYVCLTCNNLCSCSKCDRRRRNIPAEPRPRSHKAVVEKKRRKYEISSSEEDEELVLSEEEEVEELEEEEEEHDPKLKDLLKHVCLARRMMCFSRSKRVRIFARYLWLILLNEMNEYEFQSCLKPKTVLACHKSLGISEYISTLLWLSDLRFRYLVEWINRYPYENTSDTWHSWERPSHLPVALSRNFDTVFLIHVELRTPTGLQCSVYLPKEPLNKRARKAKAKAVSLYDPDRIVTTPICRYEPAPIPKPIPLPSWKLVDSKPPPTELSSDEDTSDEVYVARHEVRCQLEIQNRVWLLKKRERTQKGKGGEME